MAAPAIVVEYLRLWKRLNAEGPDSSIGPGRFEELDRKAKRVGVEIRGADARGVEWRRVGERRFSFYSEAVQ